MPDPAVRPSVPYLIHAYEHRAYPLHEQGTLSIGRDTACDITVNEVSVSRQHAGITREGDEFVLSSTGTTSTVLNGAPLTAPRALSEGDTFYVGTMKFTFTRDRLPVAMGVARPVSRLTSVDARRPTLTFPQVASPGIAAANKRGAWLALAIVAAIGVLGSLSYWLIVRR